MAFSFDFFLNVEKLTRPAKEAADALGSLVTALKDASKSLDGVDGALGRSRGGWSGVARAVSESRSAMRGESTNLRKIADDWQKMAEKAEKAEQRKTAALEREAARRERAVMREAAATAKAAQQQAREAERAAERQARAAERAARSPLFGGYSSVSGLLRGTASSKVSGMARGAASALLGAPGAIVGGAFDLVGTAAGYGMDLASSAADAAVSFGKMAISAQAMREQSVEGFKAIYGSAETSEKLFDNAVRIAKLTKFDTPEVVQHFNNLAAGGFKADELTTVFAGIADVQSARGGGFASRYSNALQKLNAQPSAMFSTFQQAAMAGPGLKLSEEVLAKQLGLKPGANIDAELRKMFRDKKISGTGAINAVLTATSQRYDQGGDLGGFARKQGEGTWEGLISNIRNGLSDVLTMKLPADHPMMKFKGILREVNSLFDETSEGGRRFQGIIRDLVADVFELFNLDEGTTTSVLDGLLSIASEAEKAFGSFTRFLKDELTEIFSSGDWDVVLKQKLVSVVTEVMAIGSQAAIAGVAKGLGASRIGNWFAEGADLDIKTAAIRAEATRGDSFARRMAHKDRKAEYQAGVDILDAQIQGVTNGTEERVPWLEKSGKTIGSTVVKAVREETDTHSPSREFERIAKGWVDGSILGIERNRDRLGDSMGSALPGMQGGGGTVIHLTQHVTGGTAEETAALSVEYLMRAIGGHIRVQTAQSVR